MSIGISVCLTEASRQPMNVRMLEVIGRFSPVSGPTNKKYHLLTSWERVDNCCSRCLRELSICARSKLCDLCSKCSVCDHSRVMPETLSTNAGRNTTTDFFG